MKRCWPEKENPKSSTVVCRCLRFIVRILQKYNKKRKILQGIVRGIIGVGRGKCLFPHAIEK
jgi:hypothetical protein